MTKAFIDTTIITDILLNSGPVKNKALIALRSFESTSLPVYAIKEFKAGPLANFKYFHNKLVQSNSIDTALNALQRLSRTPQKHKTATSIQALRQTLKVSISKQTPATLAKKYGENASISKILFDEMRLSLSTIINKAWKLRRDVTSEVVMPLSCYRETPPYKKRGLIEFDSDCFENKCSVCIEMQKRPNDLNKMREAIKDSPKLENQKRSKVLREMYRKPKDVISNSDCRNLGDAVFVFFAPPTDTILTTNLQDFNPIANALGKKVASPC